MERLTELPLLVLAFVMIPLLVGPFVWDLSTPEEVAFAAVDLFIWAVFAVDLGLFGPRVGAPGTPLLPVCRPRSYRGNIYVRSQAAGDRVMASVTAFLERKLRLRVNLEKSAVAAVRQQPGPHHPCR